MALEPDSNSEIEIRDACMRYSTKHVVLQGLNMTVKKGTIYGLLGPSGCGKTTVLNCIIGISTLDSGTVFVRCQDRRQFGYMPQETALIPTFKISELLQYFGRVYGLDHEAVEKRAKDLLSLVNLPNTYYDLYISSLSGGQQRRVSLIIALIHDPDLLILDEPTVGLDPIIRFSLWEYFLKETEQRKKTILITTHYIAEAKQSHAIGLMRGGVLLAEGPAEKLLDDFNCPSLEDLFLQLSQNQGKFPSEVKPLWKNKAVPAFTDKISYCNFNRLAAQTKKNFYWVKRNLWMIAYILLIPGLMTFLFCTLHTNNLKGLQMSIVPEEPCTNLTASMQPSCDADFKFSCLFLMIMRVRGYIVSEYADVESGMDDVRRGRSLALLHFYPNYTSAFIDYTSSTIPNPPSNETLENIQLQVETDMTEKVKALLIKQDIKETFTDIQTELMKSCGYESSADSIIGEPILVFSAGSNDFVYNAFPSFIIPLVFYMATSYSASAAGSERITGLYRRSLVSGVTKLEMNLAHIAIQVLVLFLQNCLIMTVIHFGLYTPMNGNFFLAVSFIVLSEIQGMLYGILLASIIKKENHLTNTELGTVMTLFLTSGIVWPIEGMVAWLKYVVYYSPVTRAIEAYRSITIRGWGLDNPKVLSALHMNMITVAVLVAANVVSGKINRTY